MPDLIYDALDALPEAMRSLAQPKDGKFVLSLPGDSLPGFEPALRVKEFRDNNIELAKQRDALKATVDQFKDIDPAKAREALKQLDAIERKSKGKKDDEDPAAIREAMTRERDEALAAVNGELTTLREQLGAKDTEIFNLQINNGLADVFADAKLGLEPTALRDAKDAARLCWKPKDGKLIPFKDDGSVDYSGNGEPKTLREWVEAQAKERTHWKRKSAGAGGLGNPAGGGLLNGKNLMDLPIAERMRLGRAA